MKINNWFLWIGGGLVAYTILGAIVLTLSGNSISAKEGVVWNNVDTAANLLPRLEFLVKTEMKSRDDLYKQITAARNNISTAQSEKDLETAISELSTVNSTTLPAIRVVAEDNQVTSGVVQLQTGLLDETSSAYASIKYARKKLIESQQGYNNSRALFFTAALFKPEVKILGSGTNSGFQNIPTSTFSDQ